MNPRAYSDQRANDYRSMADDLTSSPIFLGMDDETRDKVLKAAYDLADKSALADHSNGQYEVSTKWMAQADDAEAQGIEPWEHVLFHTAYNEMEGTKDADGKTVKGEAKSDHVREWLEDFSAAPSPVSAPGTSAPPPRHSILPGICIHLSAGGTGRA